MTPTQDRFPKLNQVPVAVEVEAAAEVAAAWEWEWAITEWDTEENDSVKRSSTGTTPNCNVGQSR